MTKTADLTRDLVRPNTGLQQPQDATNWLAAIVSSSTDAIIGKTCDGVVMSFNPAAERLFGYRAEEIIGKPVRILIPADRQEEEDRILARTAAGQLVEHNETIRLHKSGRPIQVSISVCPVRDASGRIIGAAKIARDITERRRAEAELERMRIMLAEGQRIAHLGSFEYIAETQETVWSDEEKRIYGLDPAGPSPTYEDMLRHHIHPEDAAELDRGFREAFQSAAVFENENRIVRPDGSIRWIYNCAYPYFDSSGQLVKYIGATLDITERKRTEAERQKFVSLADHSTEFIGMCDLDFKPFYINEAGRRLVGLDSLEQACTARVQDYFFPEDRSMITNEFFPRILDNGNGEVEVRFRHFKTGEALWMIYNVFAVKDEGGQIVGYATVSRDITERKRAEEALRASEEQFRTLADAIPQLAWMANADGWIYWYNRRWYEYTGTTPEQMEGWGWQSVHDTETLPAVLERWKGSIATGEPFDMVFPLRGADGVFRLFLTGVQPLKNSEGRVVRWFGTNTDVDELKRAEEALRESEGRLAADLDAMTRLQHLGSRFVREDNLEPVLGEIVEAAIAIAGADFGNIQLLNPATNDLRIAAQRGFPQWWLDYWDRVAKGHGACGMALERGERVIIADIEQSRIFAGTPGLDIQLRAGVRAVQSSPLLSRAGKPLGMFSTHYKAPHQPDERALRLLDLLARQAADIIERAQNEEQLRQLADFDEAVLRSLGEGLYTLDSEGLVTSMNPAAEELFGWTFAELRGKKMHDITHHHYRDGRPFPACECADFQVVTHGRPLKNHEDVFIRKDGTFFDVIHAITPLRDGSGNITGLIAVFSDITERKKREAQVQLLLREVNHRAKNLLGLVQAIASQTATSQPDDFIARFSERIQALAANQDLLVKSQWQGVELRDLVRAQLAHFEGLIGSRIEIAGRSLYIAAEAAQPIAMALHELATNAGKYGALSRGKGNVSIAWDIGPDESFHLSWTETAGPVVASSARQGFGTTVITHVPEAQLGAKVVLEYPPSGVTWRLVCPAENVLAPRSTGADGRMVA